MRAPCSIHCLRQRDDEVSKAVVIASVQGLEVAHKYLIQLCNEAEAGRYTAQHSVHSDPPLALPNVAVSGDGHVSVDWNSSQAGG
jgi:hypothetical protein